MLRKAYFNQEVGGECDVEVTGGGKGWSAVQLGKTRKEVLSTNKLGRRLHAHRLKKIFSHLFSPNTKSAFDWADRRPGLSPVTSQKHPTHHLLPGAQTNDFLDSKLPVHSEGGNGSVFRSVVKH